MIPAIDWPWPDWEMRRLPLPDLPELPVPELPGTPAQWAIGLAVAAAVLGLAVSRRSSRPAAWVAILSSGLVLVATLWQLYTLTEAVDPRISSTIGPLAFGELTVPLELSASRLTALVGAVVGRSFRRP